MYGPTPFTLKERKKLGHSWLFKKKKCNKESLRMGILDSVAHLVVAHPDLGEHQAWNSVRCQK